jgi:hypothetical protein
MISILSGDNALYHGFVDSGVESVFPAVGLSCGPPYLPLYRPEASKPENHLTSLI